MATKKSGLTAVLATFLLAGSARAEPNCPVGEWGQDNACCHPPRSQDSSGAPKCKETEWRSGRWCCHQPDLRTMKEIGAEAVAKGQEKLRQKQLQQDAANAKQRAAREAMARREQEEIARRRVAAEKAAQAKRNPQLVSCLNTAKGLAGAAQKVRVDYCNRSYPPKN